MLWNTLFQKIVLVILSDIIIVNMDISIKYHSVMVNCKLELL